ncbi:MAG: prolyl oligopeptidase family serine peptidase [Epsilonproteobacteria bacterium]|nr:prolyl oligopeptidase family serine peptidase [Campylobacterota bacterium]
MRQYIKGVALSLPILLIVGCGDLDKPSNEAVEGGEMVVNFSAAMMKQNLISEGIADENSTVFGYKAYKIPYTTTDEQGNEVSASGLFVIPTGMPDAVGQIGLSMVSDDHGTIFANADAPSVIGSNNGTPDGSAIILTSLGGFATLQPDYIGFGDSNDHYHPFVQKNSLANATIDFIKTVKTFATTNSITLNNQLFLTGYSEGGYAALATLQKIEADEELTVTMAAPMAGPYDLNTTAFGVLTQPELSVPSFMANVGYAYAKTYNQEVSSIINEPYASKLPTLFDGSLSREAIDPELTTVTTGADGLFNPTLVGDFLTNPSNWFREAVLENSLHVWVPNSSVRFVHCQGDDVIPYGIAQIAEGTMKAMGAADVALIPVEPTLGLADSVGHSECGPMAYGLTTQMFSDVRKATIGY